MSQVGVLGVEVYFPSKYVTQEDMEMSMGVSTGKFTQGLGQKSMAFVTDCEDVISMSLTAVSRLLLKYDVDLDRVGRIEVGSETILDHAKSIKSHLMVLFPHGDIEGCDSLNACYGATAALFNSVQYCQSEEGAGKLAIVVAADIAEYSKGPARPTGGAGVVVMLIGDNAPLVLQPGRASHMEHVYDFYKPDLSSPFPVVDGHLSNACYLRALDKCYISFCSKYKKRTGKSFSLDMADYVVFHSPYNKLVRKSFARLVYNEFKRFPGRPEFESVREFGNIPDEDSYTHAGLSKAFVHFSNDDYNRCVEPTTLMPKSLGNTYCASLYFGLVSLIHNLSPELAGKTILMFSYGSGLTSTMFMLKIPDTITSTSALVNMSRMMDLNARLADRVLSSVTEYDRWTQRRMSYSFGKEFIPTSSSSALSKDAFFLLGVDVMGRRTYSRATVASNL